MVTSDSEESAVSDAMPNAEDSSGSSALPDAAADPLHPAVPNRKPGYRFIKRAFDIFASLMGLILLSPLFLIVSAAIFIDDPHASPFFVQKRVGLDGREFRFYKFRSMVAHAESMLAGLLDKNEVDGPVFKIKDDPRITRVGRFIRRTCIDELPQLWNVLKGDMSMVGPRPPIPREVVQYTEYQRQRLRVKPGITCFWQVQKNRNSCKFAEWVELDLKYIREASVRTDLKILCATVRTVLRSDSE